MSTIFSGANAIEAVALSKIDCKELRDQVAPCENHQIDLTAHIRGTIDILPNTKKAPSVAIPYLIVMGLFVRKMGIQRDKAFAIFAECMREALRMDEKARDKILEHYPELVHAEKAMKTVMQTMPKIPERGKVYADLQVTVSGRR